MYVCVFARVHISTLLSQCMHKSEQKVYFAYVCMYLRSPCQVLAVTFVEVIEVPLKQLSWATAVGKACFVWLPSINCGFLRSWVLLVVGYEVCMLDMCYCVGVCVTRVMCTPCIQSSTPSLVKYQKIEQLAPDDAYKPFGSDQPRFVAGAEVSYVPT